jgi:hypothetical protein
LCLDSVSLRGHDGRHYKAKRQQVLRNLSSRSAVECGAGGPLAGLISLQILQASTHSAAVRAGTIDDGNILRHLPNTFHQPSGMVDPHDHNPTPPSSAELLGHQNFA